MTELTETALQDAIRIAGVLAISAGSSIAVKPTTMLVRREWADAFNSLILCEEPYYKAAYLAVERFNKRGGA